MKNYREEIINIFNNDIKFRDIEGQVFSDFDKKYKNSLILDRQTISVILEVNDRIFGYSFIFVENNNVVELREHFNNKKIKINISDLYKVSDIVYEKIIF